jgi:ketosteroid isomerase-like protein
MVVTAFVETHGLAQLRERSRQSGFDRARGQAERDGNFRATESFKIGKIENARQLWCQMVGKMPDPAGIDTVFVKPRRACFTVRPNLGADLPGHARIADPFAQTIERSRARPHQQPSAHASALGRIVTGAVPDFEKHIVQQILGRTGPEHAMGKAKDCTAVLIVKRRQGIAIACRHCLDQRGVASHGGLPIRCIEQLPFALHEASVASDCAPATGTGRKFRDPIARTVRIAFAPKQRRLTMAPGKKTAIVQKLYAAFQRGDLPTLLEHMTDTIDWGIDSQTPTPIPWYGVGTGKEFAAGFFKALGKECEFSRFEPSNFMESDTAVTCLVSYDSTLKRNGRKVSQNVIHQFTFKGDERVARWRGWEDTARTLAAWNA